MMIWHSICVKYIKKETSAKKKSTLPVESNALLKTNHLDAASSPFLSEQNTVHFSSDDEPSARARRVKVSRSKLSCEWKRARARAAALRVCSPEAHAIPIQVRQKNVRSIIISRSAVQKRTGTSLRGEEDALVWAAEGESPQSEESEELGLKAGGVGG